MIPDTFHETLEPFLKEGITVRTASLSTLRSTTTLGVYGGTSQSVSKAETALSVDQLNVGDIVQVLMRVVKHSGLEGRYSVDFECEQILRLIPSPIV